MNTPQINPKEAMDNFTRTMKALFRVPKSEVRDEIKPAKVPEKAVPKLPRLPK